MKRLSMIAGTFLLLALTQTVMSQMKGFNHRNPILPKSDRPFCGMEQAMAKMPPELKALMAAEAAAVQENELLLYINFNENGSTVRPGFDSAVNMTSSIITRTSFCPSAQLNQEQKDEIVRLVSDEFSPFNIRITTDASEFYAYPSFRKQMCLITTVPSVIGYPSGVAGVAPFFGMGFRHPGAFAFAFTFQQVNPNDVAATVSHEVGHLLGLDHQHLFSDTCGYQTEYHPGFGSGPLAFDPLMGAALGDGINNWFAHSCFSRKEGLPQNDYELINSQVVVRPDDFPDEPAGSLVDVNAINGILERAGDADFIKINFMNPGPATITSDNIDLKVSLLSPGGHVLEEFNDQDSTDVFIPSAVGLRYMKIEAASNDNMSAQFMTGRYHISY
ncbi:MAG: hypothetical protein WBD22_05165 [Pyrinomonadaceae bacterium]